MNQATRLTLLWVLASAIALVVALAPLKASLVEGHYVPVGNDSFYHAQRVLALVEDPSNLHEYDKRVHYPEGSMLIWPWGYDYALSLIVRAGLALGVSADPMAILVHIPVFAFPLCLLLVLAICRQIQLGTIGTFAMMLAVALLPLNQGLFGTGNVDHHFAELMLVLGALASGLAWLRKPDSLPLAATTGLVMGVAPCIHNGLFVIQLPLVAAFAWSWLRSQPLPPRTIAFAGVLLGATLAASLPSQSFREGGFAFYTLSWFHVYFAACVGVFCSYLSRVKFSRTQLVIVAAASAAACIPVVTQVLLADRFLHVEVEGAAAIGEVQSIWTLGARANNFWLLAQYYSLSVYLWPLTVALCAWQLWKSRTVGESYLWAANLFGLLLMFVMIRLHVFGSLALFLPWIVFIEEQVRARSAAPGAGALASLLAVIICVAPVASQAFAPKLPGNEPYYALTYDIYPALAKACTANPGVALSNRDDANYILFHTKCAVIANNFLLTPFHEKKVREADGLMDSPAATLAARAPAVKYVFVHKQSLFARSESGKIQFEPGGNPNLPDPQLVRELMAAPLDQLPPGFRLIQELSFEKPSHQPYARLFAIEPTASAPP